MWYENDKDFLSHVDEQGQKEDLIFLKHEHEIGHEKALFNKDNATNTNLHNASTDGSVSNAQLFQVDGKVKTCPCYTTNDAIAHGAIKTNSHGDASSQRHDEEKERHAKTARHNDDDDALASTAETGQAEMDEKIQKDGYDALFDV